ncbi:MAG: hypothetical protein QNJ19_04215 [Woeseiaceae bacterium]|nr:hypothetical protein [Woeseiaceae bacterium]
MTTIFKGAIVSRLVVLLLLLGGTASAQSLPNYYPKGPLVQTAIIDAVFLDENRITIGDITYRMNPRPIVRTRSSSYDSMTKIKKGVRVAFRVDNNGEIVEFWIYPKNYRPRR